VKNGFFQEKNQVSDEKWVFPRKKNQVSDEKWVFPGKISGK
jgi:hypothetical protein